MLNALRKSRAIILSPVFLITAACGGIAALVAGIILFCTPFGPPLIVAGLADIYVEYKGDDPQDPCVLCRPPLIPNDPPDDSIPSGVLKICWWNGEYPQKSQCPLWRGSAVRSNSPDRPTWSFDASESTLHSQHITATPLRMSYPHGRIWPVVWQGQEYQMEGTSLICSLIFHDLDGDGRGDEWATQPDYYDFEAYYGNGKRVNSAAPVAEGGLGAPVYIGVGTTTLLHGWTPEGGAKFYSFDFTPSLMKASTGAPTEEVFVTKEGDILELPSTAQAAALVRASGGYWRQVDKTTFQFVAIR